MDFSDKIEAVEKRLADAGVSIDAVCVEAGLARSTWQRWKGGRNFPNVVTWFRLQEAVDRLIAARAETVGGGPV